MPARTVSELEGLLDQLDKQAIPLRPDDLELVSAALAKLFSVQSDEVAILELREKTKVLKFVLPEKLHAVGTIPLSSAAALAARTAREKRSDVVNNFAQSRHASVFEGVPLGRRQGVCIQKLMSAPILQGAEVVGVAQGRIAAGERAGFQTRRSEKAAGAVRDAGTLLGDAPFAVKRARLQTISRSRLRSRARGLCFY
jgi:hypothetical protein